MARTGVSYFDVTQAAQALQKAGLEPTIDRVREKLGTGSKSTLAPLLKRWKDQRETTVAGQGVPDDLLLAVKGLHDRAQQSAAAQIETARQAFGEAEASLRQELADRERALLALQQSHQTLEAEHASLRQTHQQLGEELHRERTAAAALGAESAELRARLTETQATHADLKQELRQARSNTEHYQQAVAEERRLEREHVQQLKLEWQAARDDWNRRLTAETAARQTAEAEVRQLLTRNQQFERLHVEQQAELASRQSEMQHQKRLLEELEPQLQALQEERLRNTADLAELRALRAQQDVFMSQQDQRIQALEAKLAKNEDRVTRLVDENRFLAQEKVELQAGLHKLSDSALPPSHAIKNDL